MSECLTKFANDANVRNLVNRKMLAGLISDNYTILAVFAVVTVLLILITYYFVSHVRQTIREYRRNNRKIDLGPSPTNNQYDVTADDESYDKDKSEGDIRLYKLGVRDEPMDYINKGKKDFIEDVKTKYDDYNAHKSQYIKTTYKKPNDDVIDEKLMFSKYDNYEYAKKAENDDY